VQPRKAGNHAKSHGIQANKSVIEKHGGVAQTRGRFVGAGSETQSLSRRSQQVQPEALAKQRDAYSSL